MATRQSRWQERRRREGLCIGCGRPRPSELGSYCVECAVKRRERRRERLGSKSRYIHAKTYQLSRSVPRKRSSRKRTKLHPAR